MLLRWFRSLGNGGGLVRRGRNRRVVEEGRHFWWDSASSDDRNENATINYVGVLRSHQRNHCKCSSVQIASFVQARFYNLSLYRERKGERGTFVAIRMDQVASSKHGLDGRIVPLTELRTYDCPTREIKPLPIKYQIALFLFFHADQNSAP